MREAKLKNPTKYWLGKRHSEATIKLLSEIKKKAYIKDPEWKKRIGEQHKGEKCYFWKGGISNDPYPVDWTKSLKKSIRERDKYTCQLCMEKQGGKSHAVHHIDYIKENNDPNNLITLCTKCHAQTNHNREYWIDYFNI